MILSICEDPKVLEISRLINIFITIIRIVVPIALIFSLMFKLVSAVSKGDEDGLSKVKKIVPKNLIAASIIFLVPTIVRLVVRVTASDISYENCLRVVSVSEIQTAYKNKMEELMLRAEENVDMDNYNVAYRYVKNIKDGDARKEYEERLKEVKTIIDESNKVVSSISTGLGKDIEPTEELIEACNWVLNDEEVQIRLQTCMPGPHRYQNASQELPGGARDISTGQAIALKTISLYDYQKGVFFGEERIEVSPESRYAFMIIYKTVFLHNTVGRAINNNNTFGKFKEIYYTAGSCAQNYRNSQRVSKYDSGKYKAEIDDAVDNTRYLVLANQDGTTTDARYHSYTGIEQQIEAAGAQGKKFVEILEDVIKSGNDDSSYYKDARVYDCRNLVDGGVFDYNSDNSNINSDIIYLGDSRVAAYKTIKELLGFDENKESIFATVGTKYDDRFFKNMNDAKELVNSNPNKDYTITVNYGVNETSSVTKFCDYYIDFVKSMNKKNKFIILSVNPFNESESTLYQQNNTNENIEKFNNYMKSTCINKIKETSPNAKVYYCDSYNSIPLDEWVDREYIASDGIHYTNTGSKYIYNYTKKCIASYGN